MQTEIVVRFEKFNRFCVRRRARLNAEGKADAVLALHCANAFNVNLEKGRVGKGTDFIEPFCVGKV